MFEVEHASAGDEASSSRERIAHIGPVGGGPDAARTTEVTRANMSAMRGARLVRVATDHEVDGPPVPAQAIEGGSEAAAVRPDGLQPQRAPSPCGGAAGSPDRAAKPQRPSLSA
jgi:hypothetical protein